MLTIEIERFIELAMGPHLNEPNKKQFHKLGKKLCRFVAQKLELEKGSYDIRSNMGGIAVSGEITLHTDHIYLQFSQNVGNLGFMYRGCKGRKDYSGFANQWMQYRELLDIDRLIGRLKRIQELQLT